MYAYRVSRASFIRMKVAGMRQLRVSVSADSLGLSTDG